MQDAANAKEHRRRETAAESLGFAFQSRAMSAIPAALNAPPPYTPTRIPKGLCKSTPGMRPFQFSKFSMSQRLRGRFFFQITCDIGDSGDHGDLDTPLPTPMFI